MKSVLILAYDFPPYVSVGGLRPYSWYKYLNEFGLYPVVITRQWGNKYGNHLDYVAPGDSDKTIVEESEFGIVIRTPYKPNLSNQLLIKYGVSRFKFIRKSISAFYEVAQWFFFVGPKSKLYFEAKNYLKYNKIDAILTTGEPYILFKYASLLSNKNNIPWIADYRDPWVQNKNRRKIGAFKIMDIFFERRVLRNVGAILTVSSFFKKQISSLITTKPIFILPNGYDPDAVSKIKNISQNNEKLSIAFVGTIYKWHPIESFLKVCSVFIKETNNPQFQVNFFGINNEDEIRMIIQTKYQNLINVVSIFSKIPNEQLLQKLAKENLFLLFNYYSYMGTKIYDYLALERQILLCYIDDIGSNELKRKYYNFEEFESENRHLQEDVINETNSGIVIKDELHLLKVLEDFYSEFKSKRFITCNSHGIEQYSRKKQTEKLAEIINKVVDENKLKLL